MQLSKKYRTRIRNRIQITLDERELRHVEQAAKSRGVPITRFARDVLVANVTDLPDVQRQEQNESIKELLESLLSRLTKLERIQRTLVLNTAYARGHAVGVLRSASPDARKIIEQEMVANYGDQKKFFFSLYPDQLEGEKKEEKS